MIGMSKLKTRILDNLILGTLFEQEGQEIYSYIYMHEHAGWVPAYQGFRKKS